MGGFGSESAKGADGGGEETGRWPHLQEAIRSGKTVANSIARAERELASGADPRRANKEGLTAIGSAMGRWSALELRNVFAAGEDDLCKSFGYPGSTGEKGMPTLLAATIALGDPSGWGSVPRGSGLAEADERLAGIIALAGKSKLFPGVKIAKEGARAAAKAGAPGCMGAYAKIAASMGCPVGAVDLVEALARPMGWSQRVEGYLLCLEQAKDRGVDLDEQVGIAAHGVPRSATLLSVALSRVEDWERLRNARDDARAVAEKLVELGVDPQPAMRMREAEYIAGRAKSKQWPAWERWSALIEARLIRSELGEVESRAAKKRL